MRRFFLCVAVVSVACSASAGVKLTVKKDGTKLITNSGGRSAASGNLEWLAGRHDRRTKYDPIIERHCDRYGVDPVLVRAVIQVESNFDASTVSHKGARGLMQLMPGTAKRYGVKDLHDPEQNIQGGVRYLAYLLELFGDMPRALAAYNAGEGAVMKYGGIPPYEETSTYVVRAMTVYHGRPYGNSAGVVIAGKRKAKLKGGFNAAPVAATLLPGVKYLGTH
jgi:soluble lytic murein transglycosylase-like protein